MRQNSAIGNGVLTFFFRNSRFNCLTEFAKVNSLNHELGFAFVLLSYVGVYCDLFRKKPVAETQLQRCRFCLCDEGYRTGQIRNVSMCV